MGQAPALDDVTADVRSNIGDLRVDFHALGLAGCIDRLTTPLRQAGATIRWETPHHGIEIPATTAALLYHCAEEILSNAFKYAKPTQLTVRLDAVCHGIRLAIMDNGLGFDVQSLEGAHHGFGLRLMGIAVHEAGGMIDVDPGLGSGTQVIITLPLD
jgi:signal transduction histidine kinase